MSVRKGTKFTEEHKRNISLSRKGRFLGKDNPNFGKGDKVRGENNGYFGKKHTEEIRQKMRKKHNMSDGGSRKLSILARERMTGKVISIEARENIRQRMINNPNRIFKDTSIELKIESELKDRNVYYKKQVPLYKIAIVDFYLPDYKVVIQCDGDYWHNLPGRREKDIRQDLVLTSEGLNVYRFWEHEINESKEMCINKVKELTA